MLLRVVWSNLCAHSDAVLYSLERKSRGINFRLRVVNHIAEGEI